MYSVEMKLDIIREDDVRFLETGDKRQLIGHIWLKRSVWEEMGGPDKIKIYVNYF